MKTAVPAKPGSYVWEVPGKPFAVYISLEVVDRLLQDVMRGFGAVPKRGAEIGGILTGRTSSEGGRLTVEVEGFEVVPIEYRRGPSYLMSDADMKAFDETFGRLRHAPTGSAQPIGMFRSHTRENAGLGEQDLELMAKYLPQPDNVFLLIRPYATRVSTAGFYVQENGKFREGFPEIEFPFRRKDLAGNDDAMVMTPRVAPQAAPAYEPPRRPEPERPAAAPQNTQAMVHVRNDGPEAYPDVDFRAQEKSGWVWLPLSFIFLLLGVLLGFQAALTLRPQQAPMAGDPFNLGLSVTKEGENLNVRWERQSPAIRTARQGVLTIDDGPFSKAVPLTASELQTGSVVVYQHHSPGDVRFRLELSLKDRDSIVEKLEWKE